MDNSQDINKTYVGSTFVEFLVVLVKYKWFLILLISISTIGATAYALLAPKWYKSTASVFPAEKNDPLSMLTGLGGLAKGFNASKGLAALTGSNSEADRFVAILKSATVTSDVINRFELRKEYDREGDYFEKVVKDWEDNLELEIQDEGNLTISVLDKDPQKAAAIANYLVEKLNTINTQLSVTNAKANREFVEKRYFQNIDDINKLEDGMREFQQKYGVIAVPEQLEATVKSMSTIYAELYKKEIELNVLKQTYGNDHPLISTTQLELTEIQKKINQLNAGTDDSQKDVKLLIPFKQAPKLGNEYLKIYRNLEIQYKILEFVQPLFEQARVEEARNTPSVIVLDKAGPADRKFKPKGTIFASLGFVISVLIGLLVVFTLELIEKIKINRPDQYRAILGGFAGKK